MLRLSLRVRDVVGTRTVLLDRVPFLIGRTDANTLRVAGAEVSRAHAEITIADGCVVLRDNGSRFGTFVNGESVTECRLRSGDRVRLGRQDDVELVFLATDEERTVGEEMTTVDAASDAARDDIRQLAAVLEGFRALGTSRVLEEVLTMVLDAALDITGAERAFIILSNADVLEPRLARSRHRQSLTHRVFEVSRRIPEEVLRTGVARVVTDLLDGDLADRHAGTLALGIRHVVCVPLRLVRYVEAADVKDADRSIGLLYLDSREKGTLLSDRTQAALATLAGEASVALESSRLYREGQEKERLEHEINIAAQIQQALLPKAHSKLGWVEAAATTIPCRSIAGDFYDYFNEPKNLFSFIVGDVAGKGPPAAFMSALLQGMCNSLVLDAEQPANAVAIMNRMLCARGLEARFVTLVFGVLSADGEFSYCNAGFNSPFVVGQRGVRRLESGGMVVGLMEFAPYEQETIQLEPGDAVVVFSDGVSEALNQAGEEFGEGRLLAELERAGAPASADALVERLLDSVRTFIHGTMLNDDLTVMVIQYLGPESR